MKKKAKKVIAIIIISLVVFLGYKITKKLNYKNEVAERIQSVPNFSFHTLKGEIFTQKKLPNKPIVFVYFNSDCDYCKSEATKIHERIEDFKNIQLIFISFEKAIAISQFAKKYKLYNKENVLFLEDRKAIFSQIFDAKSIPYILVYDANRKLLKKFKGATKIDSILELLHRFL